MPVTSVPSRTHDVSRASPASHVHTSSDGPFGSPYSALEVLQESKEYGSISTADSPTIGGNYSCRLCSSTYCRSKNRIGAARLRSEAFAMRSLTPSQWHEVVLVEE